MNKRKRGIKYGACGSYRSRGKREKREVSQADKDSNTNKEVVKKVEEGGIHDAERCDAV